DNSLKDETAFTKTGNNQRFFDDKDFCWQEIRDECDVSEKSVLPLFRQTERENIRILIERNRMFVTYTRHDLKLNAMTASSPPQQKLRKNEKWATGWVVRFDQTFERIDNCKEKDKRKKLRKFPSLLCMITGFLQIEPNISGTQIFYREHQK
ncbi:unnamed protein product, partial [Brugia timori]|uniref:PH domain-containing protein n=1 Tax=Brugia timori TaxID=42155 RepID=A0A0R3QZC0_9BILA